MKIEILKKCIVHGELKKKGDTVDIDTRRGNRLIAGKFAKSFEAKRLLNNGG